MTMSLRAVAATLLVLFLVGCGQSGPLFVPGDPSTVQPQQQPQTTQEDDEDEDNGADNQ